MNYKLLALDLDGTLLDTAPDLVGALNRLRIKHVTGFHYDGEVTASYNEARMLPASSDGQLVLYSNIEILPISSSHSYVDYWGTRVTSFEIITPHSELSLTATIARLGDSTRQHVGADSKSAL